MKRLKSVLAIVVLITLVAVWSRFIMPTAFAGVSWFILDIISIVSGGGGNLTGVGLIVGPIMAVCGYSPIIILFVFLYVRARRLSREGRESLISVKAIQASSLVCIVALLGIATFDAAQTNSEWDKKIGRERQEQANIRQQYEREEENILKLFEHNNTVHIRFSFTYLHDREYTAYTDKMSVADRKASHRKYVVENIIEPIGNRDLLNWSADGDSSFDYMAEVTKAGYEKLKNNKYVENIALL